MNGHDLLAEDLRLHLRDAADERPAQGQLDVVLSRTATIHPRPFWLVAVRGGASGARARAGASPILRVAAVAALLALLAVLAALFIAGQKPRVDGLLAFSRDGAIFLARPDGGGAVRAPRTPGWRLSLAAGPPWSPDGRYLAVAGYPSNPPPDTEPPESVFVLDSRTFELRRIGEGLFIGWSPEGHAVVAPSARSVATYSVDERAIQLIRTVDVGGPVAGDFVSAVLSPDGRWLAVTSGQYLERVDVQTGATTQLYDNGGELVDRPSWSPDSSRIAFARTQSPRCHTCMGPIIVVTADGSLVTPVSRQGRLAFGATWSPDGRWLAYVTDATGAGIEQSNIELVHPDGIERRTLPTGWPWEIAWSADGMKIRYLTHALDEADTRFTLVEIGVTDSQPRRLDDGSGVEFFSWQSLSGGSSIPPLPLGGRS